MKRRRKTAPRNNLVSGLRVLPDAEDGPAARPSRREGPNANGVGPVQDEWTGLGLSRNLRHAKRALATGRGSGADGDFISIGKRARDRLGQRLVFFASDGHQPLVLMIRLHFQ